MLEASNIWLPSEFQGICISAVRLDVEKPGQLTYVHASLGCQIYATQLQITSNLSSSSFTMCLDSCLQTVETVLDSHLLAVRTVLDDYISVIWFALLLNALICRLRLACYWSDGMGKMANLTL